MASEHKMKPTWSTAVTGTRIQSAQQGPTTVTRSLSSHVTLRSVPARKQKFESRDELTGKLTQEARGNGTRFGPGMHRTPAGDCQARGNYLVKSTRLVRLREKLCMRRRSTGLIHRQLTPLTHRSGGSGRSVLLHREVGGSGARLTGPDVGSQRRLEQRDAAAGQRLPRGPHGGGRLIHLLRPIENKQTNTGASTPSQYTTAPALLCKFRSRYDGSPII